MRQGQQNRRGRGRNNNNNNQNQNRKGQNPLTRSFESNGPDMKIRGTPAHIAEKYIAMARDAHSAGDPVLAENYLQHAEHYNRIILAYREQQISQGGGDMGGIARPRPAQLIDNTDGEEIDEDEAGAAVDPGDMPQPLVAGIEPQGQPQQRNFGEPRFDNRPQRERHEQQGHRQHNDRNERNDRHERQDRRDRFERRPDRGFGGEQRGERHQGEGQREPREFREPRDFREPREPRSFDRDRQPQHERGERPERAQHERTQPERAPVEAGADAGDTGTRAMEPRRRERFSGQHEQPEFLRRPVRRPRRETNGDGDAPPAAAPAGSDDTSGE